MKRRRWLLLGLLAGALLAIPAAHADGQLTLVATSSATQVTIGQTVTFDYVASNSSAAYHQAANFAMRVDRGNTISSVTIDYGNCTIDAAKLSVSCHRRPFDVGSTFHLTIIVTPTARQTMQAIATLSTNDASAGSQTSTLKVPVSAVDTTAPDHVSAVAAGPVSLTPSFPVAWTASDRGSGIASIDVRVRAASWHSAFGSYRVWQRSAKSGTAEFTGSPGFTYCFSAMSTDQQGNASQWSAESCLGLPLRASALRRHGPWTAASSYIQTTGAGASLTLSSVQAEAVYVVARECFHCGRLHMTLGNANLGDFNLRSKSAGWQLLQVLANSQSLRRGALMLEADTRSGPVAIAAVVVLHGT